MKSDFYFSLCIRINGLISDCGQFLMSNLNAAQLNDLYQLCLNTLFASIKIWERLQELTLKSQRKILIDALARTFSLIRKNCFSLLPCKAAFE